MIRLRMLGEIRLTAESGSELDALLRQPKRLALLAYLASPSPGTWHRRDMILALFWPELDTSRARTSLRNGLYVIRQTLGDGVIRNRGDEEISVDPALLQTDVAAVWDALKNGRTEDALAHYGGDLLPGLFPPDSAGFQRWLDGERTKLRTSMSVSAVEHLNAVEKSGRPTEALITARRVLEIQPDDETLVRRVMLLYEAVGDRAGALAVFESYRNRLATDFDAEPSPETIALVNQLRATNSVVTAKTVAAESVASSPDANSEIQIKLLESRVPAKKIARSGGMALFVTFGVILIAGTGMFLSSRQQQMPTLGKSVPLTADEGLQVEAAISPNGRLVAYATGNPGSRKILVQKIGGGSAWRLTPDSESIELLPRWSPDNDEILFLSHNGAYASPSLGGSARLVARGGEGDGMVRSASWSPTGDSVLIVRNDSLFAKPLEGAGSRLIARAPQLHSCVWSPRGDKIACVSGNVVAFAAGPLFGNEAPSAILIFNSEGGKPTDVTGNKFEHKSPAWSADGKFLFFLSNRDGLAGVGYVLKLGSQGTPQGLPERIGVEAEWISVSADRATYSVPARKRNLWSLPIPENPPVGFENANQVTTGNQVVELVTVSKDQKWLVFDSNLRGNSDVFRMPIHGGPMERLTDDPRQEYAPELSPNNQEIVWQKWVNGGRRLFVKKLDRDSVKEIVAVKGDLAVPRWSPDGASLAAWGHENQRGGLLVVHRDLKGEWQRPTWRMDFGRLPVWSPDGRTLAFVLQDGTVQTIPADSGAIRTLYRPRDGTDDPLALFLVWSADRNTIWMMARSSDGSTGIWSLSPSGGKPRLMVRLSLPPGKGSGASFASDASHFYITIDERSSNIWWAELKKR